MKLKLVVESPEAAPRDVVVTCDATATVGDVARRLAGAARSTPLTLWVDAGEGAAPRLVNPLLSIHESGVRSGARVAVAEPVTETVTGDDARARVTVVEGPDEGAVFLLGEGVNFIGRDPAVQVRLQDGLVSRRHASVTVIHLRILRPGELDEIEDPGYPSATPVTEERSIFDVAADVAAQNSGA